jgi:UDP-N-acetylglucosamine 1-carboxyvinyltransferase
MLENVWENRYQYVDYLRMMGANILTSGKLAVIQGGTKLTGSKLRARDLRAGAAMVMAALAAEGTSVIEEVEKIERGYEFFVEKMRKIGAEIKVVENNSI